MKDASVAALADIEDLQNFFTVLSRLLKEPSSASPALTISAKEAAVLRKQLSALKSLPRRVRQVQMFLDSVIDNIPDMVFVKEAEDLRFVRFNKAGEALLGYDRSELLGKNDYDFFPKHEADFFTAKDRDVLISGKLLDVPEEPIHTRHQGTRYLHTKKIPILNETGTPIFLLGISEDITEKKAAEEALRASEAFLRQKTEELERSNKELEDFAYVASHDLREPLRKMANFSELLARRYGDAFDEKAKQYFRFVIDGATRMQLLIDDLLAYARIGKEPVPMVETDFNELASRAVKTLEIKRPGVDAMVSVDPLPTVFANPREMETVVRNLISNGLKFQTGSAPRVRVTAEQKGREWVISVTDNGIGIAREYWERIFTIFQRLHTQEEFSGTGAGLASCKKIVTRHGGRIWLDSEVGKGSTFYIALPAGKTT